MSKSRLGVPFGLCIFPRHHFCKSWREIVIRGGDFLVKIADFPVIDWRNNSSEYSNSLEVHAFYLVDGTKNPPRMRGISSVPCTRTFKPSDLADVVIFLRPNIRQSYLTTYAFSEVVLPSAQHGHPYYLLRYLRRPAPAAG